MLGALLMMAVPALLGPWLTRQILGSDRAAGVPDAALGLPVGLGLAALLFFLGHLASVPAGAWRIAELILACALAGALVWRAARSGELPWRAPPGSAEYGPGVDRLVWGLVALTGAAAVMATVLQGLQHPHGGWDAVAIWNTHARFIFRDPTGSLPFLDGTIGHPEYPLLLPALVARGWTLNGGESQVVPWAVGVLYMGIIAGLLYAAVAHLRGTRLALAAGVVFLGTPMATMGAASQYADIPLACYVLLGVVCLHLFVRHDQVRFLVLAGLAAGLGAWTKREGYLFVAALAAACVSHGVMRRDLRQAVRTPAWLLPGLLPAISGEALFRLLFARRLGGLPVFPGGSILANLSSPSRHWLVATRFAGEAFHLSRWAAMPLLLALFVALRGITGEAVLRRAAARCAVLLGSMLSLYFLVYVAMPGGGLDWYLDTSLDRLLLHHYPALIFVVFSLGRAEEESAVHR